MSYGELAQHAAHIEQLAVQQALKQHGWTDAGQGRLQPPSGYDDEGARSLLALFESRFAGVGEMFTPFLNLPDPAGFHGLTAHLADALKKLCSGPVKVDATNKLDVTSNPNLLVMTKVGSSVTDWRGDAAQAFYRNFVEPFPAITANQFGLVATLKAAIDGERALWEACRADVDDIAHKAIGALDVMGECSADEQVCLLTVATSIFAVAAEFATGGWAIALSVAGAATQAWSGAPRAEPPEVRFDGQTPEAIVAQVQAALNKLAEETNAAERRIADALTASAGILAGNRSRFVSRRPALAGATAATITTAAYMGEVI